MIFRLLAAAVFSLALGTPAKAAFAASHLSCSVFSPLGAGLLARCEGPSKALDGITIQLFGQAPNVVSEVRLSGEKDDFRQSLSLSAEPLVDLETVGILFMDFNFDGLEDFAIMEFLPAGPNVPYLYFLYDREKKRFVANKDLAAITSPEFRAERAEIASYWRESAAVSGTDIYVWADGRPQLKSRTEERRSGSGCVQTRFAMLQGKLVTQSKGPCP